MIWHWAHTEFYLNSGHGVEENEAGCFPSPLQCVGYTCLLLILTLSSTGRSYTHMGNKFPCALLHCSLLQWQKAQFSSNHVFCKNEPQEEKVRREWLLHVSVSDAICSVSHVFLDISAYTDNDTWVQAIFRTDSFPFHSNNCFFNTLEYAKCFFNKLLIGSRNNSETKRKL